MQSLSSFRSPTLDCPKTNITLLSTFNAFLRAMQSMPLVFANDMLPLISFFLFMYQFPHCLFFLQYEIVKLLLLNRFNGIPVHPTELLLGIVCWERVSRLLLLFYFCLSVLFCFFFHFCSFIQKTLSTKVKTTMRRPLYWW